MALPTVGGAFYPSPNDLRDAMLRAYRYGGLRRGLTFNILPGSEPFIRFDAIAKRCALAVQNNKVATSAVSPLAAVGQDLVDICAVYGIFPRPAAGAGGGGTATCSGTVTIPKAFSGTLPNGTKVQTDAVYTINTTGPIGLICTSTGVATNTAAGTVLTWDSAAIGNLQNKATVDIGGLTGGVDTDTDDTLRLRLLNHLAAPGVGGNWSYVKQLAEGSTASVEAAFVYQAIRGPGSYDVACTKAGGNRVLAASIITTVATAMTASSASNTTGMPGQMSLNATGVAAQQVDVVLNATLALPTSAGGAGGGWRDSVPWPPSTETAPVKITVLAGQVLTHAAVAIPAVGNSIAIWDNVNQVMLEFTISAVAGQTITVLESTAALAVGQFISAGAINVVGYAAQFLTAGIQALGPGQKSTNTDILPRGLRKPGTDVQWPTDLTSIQLAKVTTLYTEVIGLDYGFRFATGTSTPQTSPGVTASTADPPFILTLNHLSIVKV